MKPDLESELRELGLTRARHDDYERGTTVILRKGAGTEAPQMPPSMAEVYNRARAKAVSLYGMDAGNMEGTAEYERLEESLRFDLRTLSEMKKKASGRHRTTKPLTIVAGEIRENFAKKPQDPAESAEEDISSKMDASSAPTPRQRPGGRYGVSRHRDSSEPYSKGGPTL